MRPRPKSASISHSIIEGDTQIPIVFVKKGGQCVKKVFWEVRIGANL